MNLFEFWYGNWPIAAKETIIKGWGGIDDEWPPGGINSHIEGWGGLTWTS